MKCISPQRLVAVALMAMALVVAVTSQTLQAALDYSQSLALDFKGTFPGSNPGAGAPAGNPFGDWELRGPNGLAADLTAVPGGIPASGQPGWCTGAGGICDGSPTYSYFGTSWQPGVTLDPRVGGHGPQDVLWTAPANVDMGGVEITGAIQQIFETARRMRISVFKNASATPEATFDALPPLIPGVILQTANFGPVTVPVAPGDTLRFFVDGSGAGGNGISTFLAWDVRLTEVTVIPEPATASLLLASLGGLFVRSRRRS